MGHHVMAIAAQRRDCTFYIHSLTNITTGPELFLVSKWPESGMLHICRVHCQVLLSSERDGIRSSDGRSRGEKIDLKESSLL